MRTGVEFFPDQNHREWARAYDRNLRDWMQRQMTRNGRDFAVTPATQAEYNAIFERLAPEFNLWLEDQARRDQVLWNVAELDMAALPEKDLGRKLPPFKLEYDNLAEVQMRFKGTAILVKGNPFYVSDVRAQRGRVQEFSFLLEDVRDRKFQTPMRQLEDFRGAPPGFVQVDQCGAYMSRVPARVNQQGMNHTNTSFKRISTRDPLSLMPKQIVQALTSKGTVLPWTPHFRGLMVNRVCPEMRLSDEVALFTKKGADPVYVSYKGRVFGKLLDDNVVQADDEDDLLQQWIKRHFAKVNLEVRA